jgi:benzoate membrane transport protein
MLVAMRSVLRDFSLPSVVAGFVAVLVGFTSSVSIVFAAAQALGATTSQISSWIWALGLGMGVTTIGLSLAARQPVLTAWSTPGAALIAATSGLSLPQATGAFVLCGVLIVAAGIGGAFERVMNRIPQAIAAALLAGVLARFGLDAVTAVASAPLLVLAMTAAYLVGRRAWPRYAVPGVLLAGIAVALAQGRLRLSEIDWGWALPIWTTPEFTVSAAVSLAVPLFIVTMASQNLPGVAAQRAAGVDAPVSRSITTTGLASVLLAPFGGYAFNLAAITAAIVMGREAHEDPARRYTAALAAGGFYLAAGLAGGAVAGLALLGTIAGGLAVALKDEAHRDAAALTFLVTLSGLTVAGIGSAFWGVLAGAAALVVQQWRRPHQEPR